MRFCEDLHPLFFRLFARRIRRRRRRNLWPPREKKRRKKKKTVVGGRRRSTSLAGRLRRACRGVCTWLKVSRISFWSRLRRRGIASRATMRCFRLLVGPRRRRRRRWLRSSCCSSSFANFRFAAITFQSTVGVDRAPDGVRFPPGVSRSRERASRSRPKTKAPGLS